MFGIFADVFKRATYQDQHDHPKRWDAPEHWRHMPRYRGEALPKLVRKDLGID